MNISIYEASSSSSNRNDEEESLNYCWTDVNDYLTEDDNMTDSCYSNSSSSSSSSTDDSKTTVKALYQIMHYYRLKKCKGMTKTHMLQTIQQFEMDPVNVVTVRKRKYMWHCLAELRDDAYFKPFILMLNHSSN